jgi:heptosyltransferase-2
MVIVPKKTRPVLKPNGSAKEILQKYNLTRNKYILIFPEATSFTKCWLPEYFAELIDLVGQELQVIIAGNESELTDRLRRLAKSDFIDLMGKTSLKQLISLIAGSKAVIANDSGPAHLAAALAKPQVTIFGGTSPRLGFAPMNPKGVIISHDLPCSPCSLHGSDKCRLEHFNCMKMILPKDVYEMLLTIIES